MVPVVPPFFWPGAAAWPLEDFISVSTAAPYCSFRRAAPGRVRGPAATGFAPTTGSLGQGIPTTPALSGIRDVLTKESYQGGQGVVKRDGNCIGDTPYGIDSQFPR